MMVKEIIGNARGISSVEFAIILPVFLLLIFGMIQFGLGWWLSQLITNGAREGARFGVVVADPPITDAQVQQRVVDYLTSSGVSATTDMVAVTYDGVPGAFAGCDSGCAVSVQVSVPVLNLMPVLFPLFPSNLQATAVMRHE